jgi:hypothetical protein
LGHGKLRAEKKCLNCNSETVGRYCHACGQENIEPKESVGNFFKHFFEDLTHFEGGFFRSMKALLFKPGFLSSEFMVGKRQTYLHPIRFYIFSSFVFFFLIFIIPNKDTSKNSNNIFEINYNNKDTVANNDSLKTIKDTSKIVINNNDSSVPGFIQKKLKKLQKLSLKERGDYIKEINKNIAKKTPQLLWVVLPLIIWLLKLINLRHKEYWYVNHGVFAIHITIFIFTVFLLQRILNAIGKATGWGLFEIISGILLLLTFIYIILAFKHFYKQGWIKTILKSGFIISTSMVLIIIAFLFALVFTVFI